MRGTALAAALLFGCYVAKSEKLRILQLNLWVQGENVAGGTDAIVDIIDTSEADVVFLCETNGSRERFLDYLSEQLAARGKSYEHDSLYQSMGILSRYSLSQADTCIRLEDPFRPNPVCKATIRVQNREIALYSVHWDWTHNECYMPRGYSGSTWKKLPAPADNADTVLEANRMAFREEGVAALLDDARTEIAKGNIVILGGDFNEPSHLDWQQDTRLMRDHNNLVINWDCSSMLISAGFCDAYRKLYPNPVTHPGFTFPAGNRYADINKLTWLPDKDERDRIDFIYYYKDSGLKLVNTQIIGPRQDILHGKICPSDSLDNILEPPTIWPSDHKGIIATFTISD